MRADGRMAGAARRLLQATAVACYWLAIAPAPAAAQSLKGYAQVQYQLQDRAVQTEPDIEWWLRTVHFDYGTRIQNRLDLTAQAEWNDLSYVGRPDRQIRPRGSLRLAHREFGGFVSYRPLRVTDALGVTTRQRETTVSGYMNRPGLPQLQGSYIRRRQLEVGLTPASTSINRSLLANQTFGPLSLRASWGDVTRNAQLGEEGRNRQTTWTGGGLYTFGTARVSGTLSYDILHTRRRIPLGLADRSTVHSVLANASRKLSKKADATLSYGYRRSSFVNNVDRDLDDHQGSLLLQARPFGAVTVSGGGGVRTARFEERELTERYVLLTTAVQGRVRPGWTGSASLSRSYNWLPGEDARAIDAIALGFRFRLAQGLDAAAASQISAGRASRAVADTSGQRVQVTAQSSLGLTATPLPPITVSYAWSEYRSGGSLFDPDATSRGDNWTAHWRPAPSLQFSGSLRRSRGLTAGSSATSTRDATAQWTPTAAFQATGTYTRSDRTRLFTTGDLSGTEVYGLRLLASLSREWRIQLSLNDADPGRPTRVRHWDVTLTRLFRR